MIKNQWYIVMESNEIGRNIVKAKRLGENLVFWRDSNGKLYCMTDKCAHRYAALSKGEIVNDRIQCPFHGLEYSGDGACRCIPANGKSSEVPERFKVTSYPVYENYGYVWIFWGDKKENIPEVQFFDDLGKEFTFASIKDNWNAHYSRVIENQLDVAHVPFVHRTTIGRGNRTLVDGPAVKWINEGKFYLYSFNKLDDGSTPRKPEEIIPDDSKDFKLEFIFPNLWQNHIAESVRVLAAFVPVDNENTILYLRFYQKFIKIPVLNKAAALLAMPYNRKILHQDRRIVTTQEPKQSELKSGEELFQADRPIIEYRKKRNDLKAL
jgi:phenylpropionate dioxygenase-like ring-hydroxylating dioxygenase large terminal subunit